MIRRLSILTEQATNLLLILLISALTVSTALQVITRFIIKAPLVWTEEVSRMTFIWTTMLGASLATKHRTHLSVDLLSGKLSRRVQGVLDILVFMMMTTVGLIFILAGWAFVQKNLTRISETAGIPMIWLYISGPVSGGLMLIYLLEQLPELWAKVREALLGSVVGGRDPR